jgi:hypothetical protein
VSKPRVAGTITVRVKAYDLLRECVENGIAYGWNRARKHVDDPDPETVKGEIEAAVMNEICEWFSFDEP